MNIFEQENAIIGDAGTERQKQDFDAFWAKARAIRKQLGKQSFLLDSYLSQLFKGVNQKLSHDAVGDGFDTAGQLIGVCAGIIRGEPEKTEHWFYKQAKKYIDSHPLPFQDVHTKIMLYYMLLYGDFIEIAAERYHTDVYYDIHSVMDVCDLHDQYAKICGLLGGEEAMENLNTLFSGRFLSVDTMSAYFQGMNNQLSYCLAHRDRETSKQVFQLLMDMEEERS
mgnify:CR=1 FL=1